MKNCQNWSTTVFGALCITNHLSIHVRVCMLPVCLLQYQPKETLVEEDFNMRGGGQRGIRTDW